MRWNVNLNLYRSFYYVVKYGGFTKASLSISISQSALSSNIKKLEEELDIILLRRIGTRIELTKEGEELYFKLQQIYHIFSNPNEKKRINIGCLRFIADNYLEESILQFYRNNQSIQLNIQILDSGKLYQMLKRNELDFIISRYPTFYRFEDSISVENICTVENVFVCSKDFYQENKDNILKNDYCFPMILPNRSEKRRMIETYLKENNYHYSVIAEIPNSNLLKRLILSGIGIGYLNKRFVLDELENGTLVILDLFQSVPLDSICLFYHHQLISKEAKQFIHSIKTTIQKSNT